MQGNTELTELQMASQTIQSIAQEHLKEAEAARGPIELNYPRDVGVKAGMSQTLSEFLGTPSQFRDFFSYKERHEGRHLIYTPTDVRELRLKVLKESGEVFEEVKELPPVIVSHTSKGGVGKTTLASNLAVSFSLLGLRTLIIDTDPQGSASEILGVDTAEEDVLHIGELLKRQVDGVEVNIESAIKSIYPEGMLDLLPTDITLASSISWMDRYSVSDTAFSTFMKIHLDFFSKYDVVVIDTAPSTSKLTRAILRSVKKEIVTPVTTDGQSIKALRVLNNILKDINEYRSVDEESINPLIITNAYRRSKESSLGLRKLLTEFRNYLYPDLIPHTPAFARQFSLTEAAPNENLPGVERNPNSVGAKAMIDLAKYLSGRFNLKIEGIPNVYNLKV